MKKIKNILILCMVVLIGLTFTSCKQRVEAGNVGIKFHLLGGEKGVDQEVLSPGKYFIGWNTKLYIFPTHVQNYVWTENPAVSSPNDESFEFQDINGLELHADIGITYRIPPEKVPLVFETYKRGIEEITDIFLRNMVSDALIKRTSILDIEYIYGIGRTKLIEDITRDVDSLCRPAGIDIAKIYWIGKIRLPDAVKEAINLKTKATQMAQLAENEIRKSKANADKRVAEARGIAESIKIKAKAQAEANKLLSQSLTKNLIEYEKIKKWNGVMPKFSGGGTPLVNLN